MYTPARLISWATPILVLTLLLTGSITQAMAQRNRSCPVGGVAITACPIIDDQVIRDRIASRFAGSVSSRAYPVTISVCNGIVTLSGQVEDQGRWDLAYFLAACVPGVVQINNHLTVNPQDVEALALFGQVRDTLRRQPFDTSQVRVRVNEGVVQLSGMVRTEYDRFDAAAAVQGVPGVTAVYNNITVVNLRDTNNF